MEKRPIIFLDVDGVLNRTATAPQLIVERDKVEILNEICASTGAEVVLTTYWRHFEEYIGYIFMRHDCLEIEVVGRTEGKPHWRIPCITIYTCLRIEFRKLKVIWTRDFSGRRSIPSLSSWTIRKW